MDINLTIEPLNGAAFLLPTNTSVSISELKSVIAKKFKLSREQIVLIRGESKLEGGTIESNSLEEGSRIRLMPSIETGLVTHRPDETAVLEALNSLNSDQIREFLTGKSPLNLTMRLGEHVMLIQLQLSKVGVATTNNPTSSTKASQTLNSLGVDDMGTGAAAAGGSQTTSNSTTTLSSASKSLTQTLRKLSSNVKNSSIDPLVRNSSSGIYSGSFSGLLNPGLQDTQGAPIKSVSTILHILNDLLGECCSDKSSESKPTTASSSSPSPQQQPITSPPPQPQQDLEDDHLRLKRKVDSLRELLSQKKKMRRK